MGDRLQTAIASLEAATEAAAEAATGELDCLLGVMSDRSKAAIEFRRTLAFAGRDLSKEEKKRLAAVHESGIRIGERLLIRRAALRNEMKQLTASGRVLQKRAPAPNTGCRLNCRG